MKKFGTRSRLGPAQLPAWAPAALAIRAEWLSEKGDPLSHSSLGGGLRSCARVALPLQSLYCREGRGGIERCDRSGEEWQEVERRGEERQRSECLQEKACAVC